MSGLRRVIINRILARYTPADRLTYWRVSEECFCGYGTAARNLKRLVEEGSAHISAWEKRSGNPMPIYVLGPGRNAPRPTFDRAKWRREYNRAYWANHPTFARKQALKKRAQRAGLNVTIHLTA